jgi:hypothetical protein
MIGGVMIAMLALAVAIFLAVAGGDDSGSFSPEAFNDLKIGASQDHVRDELGNPGLVDSSREVPLDSHPEVRDVWEYSDGKTLYGVFFSQSGAVEEKGTAPCSKLFEDACKQASSGPHP